jgi:hypothetical protein
VNHGTDHSVPGSSVGDSPIYTRLGYSTATAPLHDGRAWREPLEQSVALIDDRGRASHRAGMELIDARLDGQVAVAASVAAAHWIDAAEVQTRHGSGITGDTTSAGRIRTVSLVRGPWEVRLVHLDAVAPAARRLRIGGWPLAADIAPVVSVDASAARAVIPRRGGDLESSIRLIAGTGTAAIVERGDASPLGSAASVPVIERDATAADENAAWTAVLITLDAARTGDVESASVELADGRAAVTWPDGVATTHDLTIFRSAPPTDR